MQAAGKTVIDLNGCSANDSKNGHCGYCHNQKPDAGHTQWSLVSPKTSVVDYQKMMDRGWRRCGTFYYKYDFLGSCCQPYTIRLDTNEYNISDSQKKVMKRFNKFLLGEIGMDGKKIAREPVEVPMVVDSVPAQEGAQREAL